MFGGGGFDTGKLGMHVEFLNGFVNVVGGSCLVGMGRGWEADGGNEDGVVEV